MGDLTDLSVVSIALLYEETSYLHRHGVKLLEDVAEVGLVGLVTPHGEVVEVQDGDPVLEQAVQDGDLGRAHLGRGAPLPGAGLPPQTDQLCPALEQVPITSGRSKY